MKSSRWQCILNDNNFDHNPHWALRDAQNISEVKTNMINFIAHHYHGLPITIKVFNDISSSKLLAQHSWLAPKQSKNKKIIDVINWLFEMYNLTPYDPKCAYSDADDLIILKFSHLGVAYDGTSSSEAYREICREICEVFNDFKSNIGSFLELSDKEKEAISHYFHISHHENKLYIAFTNDFLNKIEEFKRLDDGRRQMLKAHYEQDILPYTYRNTILSPY